MAHTGTQAVTPQADVAAALGAFAARLRFAQIPPEAVHRAKQIVLDTVGTALGGYRAGFGPQVVAFTRRTAPGDVATVLGDGARVSMEGAAFANATMAKMLGMDDSHRAYGHVAAEVLPAALAATESRGGSGRELIVALVAAYEVFGRVGRQVRRTQIARGFDIKGTVGALGSAVAAAVGLGLEAEQVAHALALATALGSGLETYVHDPARTHTKDLISGFAARNGVFAALLAQDGFRGPRGALEEEAGFGQAFGDGFDAERALEGLGERFEITTTGFKPHAGCRHVHQGVDAALAARRQGPLDPDEIVEVEVATYRHAVDAPFRTTPRPETASAAGYSLPVATAVGLVFGGFYPEDIARFQDPRVEALAAKVRLRVDPAIEALYPERNGCAVRVRLRDGRVVAGAVTHARGEPENMLTDEEFEEKFRRVSGDVLPADQRERLIQRIWTLEEVEDVRELTRLASTGRLRA
jgi:2-methylcitrate dehydratase PrpD